MSNRSRNRQLSAEEWLDRMRSAHNEFVLRTLTLDSDDPADAAKIAEAKSEVDQAREARQRAATPVRRNTDR